MKKHLLSYFLCLIGIAVSTLSNAEEMPSGYYNGIDGKQGAVLKGTLRQCIRAHTVIPYGSGTGKTYTVTGQEVE